MKTYNFFDLKDLAKFFVVISWDFRKSLTRLNELENKRDVVQTQSDLTDAISDYKEQDLANLKNDICAQIKSKNEHIEKLISQRDILETINGEIFNAKDFKTAFEIISKM